MFDVSVAQQKFSGETKHTPYLLTPDKEPMIEQSMDITKVQHGEPMSSIWVSYRSVGEEFLRGAEMTQKRIHHQSAPQHGWQLTKLGIWNGQHSLRLINKFENVLSKVSVRLDLFQAAQLVSAPSKQLVWSQSRRWSLSCLRVYCVAQLPSIWRGLSVLLLALPGRGLVNLVSFRDLMRLF